MKKKLLFAFALLSGITTSYFLKKANATELPAPIKAPLAYNIGDAVNDFKLKSIDGKTISMANFTTAKGFIIIFTSNHCPFSKAYEERMIALDKKYASLGFPVLAINPNDPNAYEEDSFANMQARAKEIGYTFPYLADESQTVAKAFGAARTPHVYVLKKEGEKNIIQYIGAIDDNAQDPASVTKRYVEDAVNNLMAGKPVITTTTKAVGCAIKWKA